MAKDRLFGTDGVRGVANEGLTAQLALNLGAAVGRLVREDVLAAAGPVDGADVVFRNAPASQRRPNAGAPQERPFVVIGRDTRISGDMLEAALAAGFASMGLDVVNVGVVPTPAVARIVLSRGAAAGAVISASHNPFDDNGIKFFGRNGKKLPDSIEDAVELAMARPNDLETPTGPEIGRIVETTDPVEDYVERVMATMRGIGVRPLAEVKLVVDCANGAASVLAPRILHDLGADIHVIHALPDGVNINVHCGSTKPRSMADAVLSIGAHLGMAFDGDADRVILADEFGRIVDGDMMMAILALHLKQCDLLPGDVVVATIMSNVGLEQALAEKSIRLHRTDVGDRYVMEAMASLGAAVGGEQSGHILLPQLSPTGDGLLTALQVLRIMRETGKSLSDLAMVMHVGPQLLSSIRVRSSAGWSEDPDILNAIADGERRLGNARWLSVRLSGTEPLIRVMAQGADLKTVESVVQDICAIVQRKYGE